MNVENKFSNFPLGKQIKFLKGNNLNQTTGGQKKMNMKKLGLMALMATLITMGLAGMVNAGPTGTFVAPLDNAVIKNSSYVFNISILSSDTNISNCSLTGSSSASSNTLTTTYMYNSSCGSSNGSCAKVTIDTTTMHDASDWTFDATCYNTTNATGGAGGQAITVTGITGVTIDNVVPVLSSASPADLTKDTDGTITFSYVCKNTTAATLYAEDSGGYTLYSMTESADNCTYSNLKLLTNGFHSWYIRATDGTNQTTSSVLKVEVRRPGGSGTAEGVTISGDTTGGTGQAIGGGLLGGKGVSPVVIGGVAVLIYLMYSKKKKKK